MIETFLVLENKFNLENLFKVAFGTIILIVLFNYFKQQFYDNRIGFISKIKIFYSRIKNIFLDFMFLINPDNFDHRDEFLRILIWILLYPIFYSFMIIIGIASTLIGILMVFFIIYVVAAIIALFK